VRQSNPLITTVIPTYKRPRLLRRAIESALIQGGNEVQVCVYDNASNDGTFEMVYAMMKLDSRIRYYCHSENVGSFKNFQFALSRIDTPFFSILSDDDILLPGFYSDAIYGLHENPDAILSGGITIRMNQEGQVFAACVENWSREGLFLPIDSLKEMLSGNPLCWTSVLFRKEALSATGGLDEEVGGPSDHDFILRLAARYQIVVNKKPYSIFMLHGDSFSETAPLSAFWPGWLKMIGNMGEALASAPELAYYTINKLNLDAKKMLFRRSANALAKNNLDFALSAANILDSHYRAKAKSRIIRTLAWAVATVPFAANGYATLYRALESILVRSRFHLQKRYGAASRYF
jgi:glycosyltransferase involved in cell wall biosynthesis